MFANLSMCSVLGRILRSSVNGFLAAMFMLFLNAGVTLAEPFEPEGKSKLVTELQQQQAEAHNWALYNQGWDLCFKIALLLLGILSAVGAALVGAFWKDSKPPFWLTVGNIIVGAAITGLTAFAFSQLNFPARAELYRKKEFVLRTMVLE